MNSFTAAVPFEARVEPAHRSKPFPRSDARLRCLPASRYVADITSYLRNQTSRRQGAIESAGHGAGRGLDVGRIHVYGCAATPMRRRSATFNITYENCDYVASTTVTIFCCSRNARSRCSTSSASTYRATAVSAGCTASRIGTSWTRSSSWALRLPHVRVDYGELAVYRRVLPLMEQRAAPPFSPHRHCGPRARRNCSTDEEFHAHLSSLFRSLPLRICLRGEGSDRPSERVMFGYGPVSSNGLPPRRGQQRSRVEYQVAVARAVVYEDTKAGDTGLTRSRRGRRDKVIYWSRACEHRRQRGAPYVTSIRSRG